MNNIPLDKDMGSGETAQLLFRSPWTEVFELVELHSGNGLEMTDHSAMILQETAWLLLWSPLTEVLKLVQFHLRDGLECIHITVQVLQSVDLYWGYSLGMAGCSVLVWGHLAIILGGETAQSLRSPQTEVIISIGIYWGNALEMAGCSVMILGGETSW